MTMHLNLSEAQRLLCRAVAGAPAELRHVAAQQFAADCGQEAALAMARANEVETVVGHCMLEASWAENPAIAPWAEAHEANLRLLTAYLGELDRLAARLAGEGIALVALKNGGIARGIYPCPGCCPMGDLDVMVERRHFRRAHEILLAEGYHFEFRSQLEEASVAAAEAGGGAEYWKILPGGEKLWFELQWRPVAGRWIRPDQEPRAEELMARSIPVPGTAVRLLAPEDNLLQVALHTAKHSYVRAPGFRLHLDVDRIVRHHAIDWAVFLDRVVGLQVKTAAYFSLALPAALFDTQVPAWVLDRLRPHAWRERLLVTWLHRAGLFDPHARKFGRLGFIVFTALLYDDLAGFWRSLFPGRAWMRQRYAVRQDWRLPYYYLRRAQNLMFRRVL